MSSGFRSKAAPLSPPVEGAPGEREPCLPKWTLTLLRAGFGCVLQQSTAASLVNLLRLVDGPAVNT